MGEGSIWTLWVPGLPYPSAYAVVTSGCLVVAALLPFGPWAVLRGLELCTQGGSQNAMCPAVLWGECGLGVLLDPCEA